MFIKELQCHTCFCDDICKVRRHSNYVQAVYNFARARDCKGRRAHKIFIASWVVASFPRASITRCYGMSSLKNRNLFPYSSGVYKSKIKVLVGLISPMASLGLQMTVSLMCFHIVVPLHVFISYHFVSKFPFLIKDTSHIEIEPILKTSF